ncbi:MAG: NmrA family NAD(P)-binding protein [Stackebrandtia sp.]
MSIEITTPTGKVGSRVLRLLRQAGARPRVLLRDPGRLPSGIRDEVDVRAGDLTDASYVREALSGSRTVLWVDPTPNFEADPVETSLRTAQPLVDAAAAGDIERVVFISSGGAEQRHGVGHIDALGGIEERLDATGIDVTHLRCGYFFTNLLFDLDGLAAGVLTTGFHPDRRMPWVDPRDVGEVAAARLLGEDWHGRVVQGVHGPEDLSFADVAGVLSEVLDRAVRLETTTDEASREALLAAGLPESAVEAMLGMTIGSRDLDPQPPRDSTTTTPTTLESWAYAALRPAVASAG